MKSPSKTKVLCFTDSDSGRDIEMILPIRYFAERFLNCSFYHAVSFDSFLIYALKPDVIFLPSSIGSVLNYNISKIAEKQNIPLFALISEGNFNTDGSFDHWGYNRDKYFYEDFVCCWSERTKQYFIEREPREKDKIVLTGGCGFDRFIIYDFTSKEKFLRKYNKNKFSKTVGYGAWTFNKLNFERGRQDISKYFDRDESRFLWVEQQRVKISSMLKSAVENNNDVLFIIKKHPQDESPELNQKPVTEFDDLYKHENVLIIGDEEPLHDIINVSDFWTCFESTTALEAWLMKKETVFINPEPDFKRPEFFKGSVIARDPDELNRSIRDFFNNGKLPEFHSAEKTAKREELIKNIIGWGDGMNHIRTALYFSKTVDKAVQSNNRIYKFSFMQFLKHIFVVAGGLFYYKPFYKHIYKLKKHLWVFENYRLKMVDVLYKRYSNYLNEYYRLNLIDDKFKSGNLFDELFKQTDVSREF